MINIDLLPQENRKKKAGFELPDNSVLLICVALITGVICLDLLLWATLALKNLWFRRNSAVFDKLKNDAQTSQELKLKIDNFKENKEAVEKITSARLVWAGKLEKTGQYLSSGMWLTEMVFKDNKLSMKGDVISLRGEEVAPIKEFVNKLRSDPVFSGGFLRIELDSVVRKKIVSWEVMDFSISGTAHDPGKDSLPGKKGRLSGKTKKVKK